MTNPHHSQSIDLPKEGIEDEDLIDLWKYFQDRADTLKDRQWTVVTWILALVSGLIVFSLDQETFSLSRDGITIAKPIPLLVIGMAGVLLCIYGLVVVKDYGKHIQRNWDRTNRVKERIIPLDYFWKGEFKIEAAPTDVSKSSQKSSGIPRESWYLIAILVGYFLLFLGMVFAGLR